MFGDDDRERALEPVQNEGRGSEFFIAGPQDIGGADIAGTDGADIAEAGEQRKDQAERD